MPAAEPGALDLPHRARILLLGVFAVVATVHLVCQLVGADTAADVTQVLLVLPLLGYAATRVTLRGDGGGPGRLLLLALVWCWLGDTVPRFLDGDPAFLALVGCFLVAQLAFIALFWRYRRSSIWAVRRWLLVPYLVAFAVLVALCAPHAGVLLPAVLVYGVCLVAMAVLATGLGAVTAAGGAVFLVSDGLIALGAFAPAFEDLPYGDFWVMLTYSLALLLLAVGSSARLASRPAGPTAAQRT